MKSKNCRFLPTPFSQIFLSTTCAAFCAIQSASAADGTWTADASGLWSTPGNWLPGDVADGSGFTANFYTNDSTTISYLLPGGLPKNFLRLKVLKP